MTCHYVSCSDTQGSFELICEYLRAHLRIYKGSFANVYTRLLLLIRNNRNTSKFRYCIATRHAMLLFPNASQRHTIQSPRTLQIYRACLRRDWRRLLIRHNRLRAHFLQKSLLHIYVYMQKSFCAPIFCIRALLQERPRILESLQLLTFAHTKMIACTTQNNSKFDFK